MIRVAIVTGYAAHARFLARLSEEPIGQIPCVARGPYASGSMHLVYRLDDGRAVFSVEPRHRRYEFFAVPEAAVQPLTD